MNNVNNTPNILQSLVPKCCKMVNGRLQGGFINWEGKEGKAVSDALSVMKKYEEIKKVIEKRDYAFDGQEFGATYSDLDNIIDEIKNIINAE